MPLCISLLLQLVVQNGHVLLHLETITLRLDVSHSVHDCLDPLLPGSCFCCSLSLLPVKHGVVLLLEPVVLFYLFLVDLVPASFLNFIFLDDSASDLPLYHLRPELSILFFLDFLLQLLHFLKLIPPHALELLDLLLLRLKQHDVPLGLLQLYFLDQLLLLSLLLLDLSQVILDHHHVQLLHFILQELPLLILLLNLFIQGLLDEPLLLDVIMLLLPPLLLVEFIVVVINLCPLVIANLTWH